MAMAKENKSEDVMNAERKMFARVNGGVQCGALHPFDLDTLVPLSKSDYGHGIVTIEELATWGRSQLPPFDFKPANSTRTPATTGAGDGPAPLTRNEIANCFAGLRGWDVERWKAELSSPDDWLQACQQRKGTRGRGGYESTWWPVCIAVAMVDRNDTTAKMVCARFKSQEPLKPWLDALRINYPDDV